MTHRRLICRRACFRRMRSTGWGTDHLGRDIFSRLMAATRVSLGSVMACLLLVLTLGLVIGGSAGLIGGRVDQATMARRRYVYDLPDLDSVVLYGWRARHRADQRNYRHRPVALGVVCTHGAQPGDFTTPTRVCAGVTAFRCGPCAGVCRSSGRRGDPFRCWCWQRWISAI
ncbi:nickel ABC transporter, permease protein [Escherichia coli]|nr:nickel ABC transporter, permease protein [Escherichia coli]